MKQQTGIEGLRAVAVLTVLGFHAAVPFFGGGYVGVDVFFVISGFLITGLLLAEISRTGRVSLKEFYARRARRILPAAGVVLLATAIGCWLLLPPLRAKYVAYDLLASALNVGNWRFVAENTDYLAASRDPSPVLHFWSLGVEEQFYLVWAPLLLIIALAARRFGRSARPFVAVGTGVVTVLSFVLCLDWTSTMTPLAYMGSPSRAWEFGIGALAAFVVPLGAVVRWCLGWVGLAAILWSTVAFSSATAFPGAAALVPTLGTAAVILGGTGGVGRLLSLRPLRAIGRLSYSWYLWHWPVLVLAEARFGVLGWPVRVLLIGASGILAALTLRLVERPLRFSVTISAMPKRGLAIGATAIMIPLAAGLLLGSDAQRVMTADSDTVASALPLGAVDGPNLLAGSVDRPGRQVVPATDKARGSTPPVPGCEIPPAATTGPPCLFGDTSSPDRVVLLGDSHASQWFSAVSYFAKQRHWAVQVLVKQGCPLAELTVTNPVLGRVYTECDTWRRHTLDQIAGGPKPKLIVVSSLNQYTGDQQQLKAGWDATLGRLAVTGAPIAYVRDTPTPGKDIPVCVSGKLMDWNACSFARQQALRPDPVVRQDGIKLSIVDLNGVLCPLEQCPAVSQGILLYRDDSHITDTVAVVLQRRFEKALQGQAWTELWRDDFSGSAGSGPSQANWFHDTGTCYPGCPARQWGTGEIETMTDSTRNVQLDGNGHLAITPLNTGGQWTSGRIESRRTDFQPPAGGVLRVEASIQQPDVSTKDGAGYWSAFWMLGEPIRATNTGWPGAGEVDVMEAVDGHESVFGTMHCGTYPQGPCNEPNGFSSGEKSCPDCQRAFHAYAVEIDDSAKEVRWYLDGKEYFRVSKDKMGEQAWRQATGHGFFLILNVAIGGNLPGPPGQDTLSGRPMLVDSVTVSSRA